MRKLENIFKLETISFRSYANENDEEGLWLPFSMNDRAFEIDCDVKDAICLSLSAGFDEHFAQICKSLTFRLSTDEVIDTKTDQDSAMLFRAELIKYEYNERTDEVVDVRAREAEVALCPSEDESDGLIEFINIDSVPMRIFNLNIWGRLKNVNLNQNRKCRLKVQLANYELITGESL